MFIRKHFVTNSSSTNFIIVTKVNRVTADLIMRTELTNPEKIFWREYWDDPDYWGSFPIPSAEQIAEAMNSGDPDYPLGSSYVFGKVSAVHLNMIEEALIDNLPDLVIGISTKDEAEEFYNIFMPVDLWKTYKNVLANGYHILVYAASDEKRWSIHSTLDSINSGAYPAGNGEFIYVESNH
jgi:hypothetical protein